MKQNNMSEPTPTVRVGVAALIPNAQGALVIGKRKGSSGHGKLPYPHPSPPYLSLSNQSLGQFGFPGGHQEVGETYFQCAEREAREETGLEVTAERVVAVTDSFFDERTHYITIFVQCRHKWQFKEAQVCYSGLATYWFWRLLTCFVQVLEPEKCYGWITLTWAQIKEMAEGGEAEETTQSLFFLPIVNLLKEFPDISVLHKLALGPDEGAGARIQPIS